MCYMISNLNSIKLWYLRNNWKAFWLLQKYTCQRNCCIWVLWQQMSTQHGTVNVGKLSYIKITKDILYLMDKRPHIAKTLGLTSIRHWSGSTSNGCWPEGHCNLEWVLYWDYHQWNQPVQHVTQLQIVMVTISATHVHVCYTFFKPG